MTISDHRRPLTIYETVDTFVAAIPWGEWRIVLVHRREHGGRAYVRLR